jgi:hypothetical protein
MLKKLGSLNMVVEFVPEGSTAVGFSPKGLTARVAVLTAFLVALAGLIDGVTAVLTKSESLTCSFGVSLPWCGPRTGARTIADFVGEWTNKVPKTGITRVSIGQRLDKAIVRAWGACEPTDCDWGNAQTAASSANSGTLQVEWNPGFDITHASLTIGEGNRLEVRTKTHFTDNSGRPDYESVYYFERH